MFEIVIYADSAAFGETRASKRAEIARILRVAAANLEEEPDGVEGRLRDSNGNRAGYWRMPKEEQ